MLFQQPQHRLRRERLRRVVISTASRCYSNARRASARCNRRRCRDLYSVTMLFQQARTFARRKNRVQSRDLYSVTMLFQHGKLVLAAAVTGEVVISTASRCYSNPSRKLSKTTSAYSRSCEHYSTAHARLLQKETLFYDFSSDFNTRAALGFSASLGRSRSTHRGPITSHRISRKRPGAAA